MPFPRFVAGILSLSLVFLGVGVVYGQTAATGSAQAYPNKLIRILTPEAGGGGDIVARFIAQGLTGSLGQQVIVDNRSMLVTIETVAKGPPDGYALLVTGNPLWLMPLVQTVSYDAVRDFSPVTLVASSPNVLVVHPSLPVRNVKELIALAKARPGELNFSSGTTGSSTHLAPELFNAMAGVNIVRVKYRGTGAALNALSGGEVQLMMAAIGAAAPHVKSGRLRELAITSLQPSVLAPGLPTVAASGLSGYDCVSRFAIFAPAKTPDAIIARLNQEILRVLNAADIKERFINIGVEAVGSSPDQLAAAMKSEMAKMGKVIKDAGIRDN